MLFNLTAPPPPCPGGREGGGLCVCSGRALCVSTGCPLTPSQTCPGLEGSRHIFLGVSCFLCVCAPYPPPIKPTPPPPPHVPVSVICTRLSFLTFPACLPACPRPC
ncbi:unnamed protein product [Boreogadus saida]